MLADRAEKPGHVRGRGSGGQLRGQQVQQGCVRAVRAGCRQDRRGPALTHLAHALERLGVGQGAEQGPEPVGQRRVGQRLGAGEDLPQVRRGQERGQDQIDETALVAPSAPVVQPPRGVDVEGAVAAAERGVVPGQRGELLGDPQFGERPQAEK